MNKILSVVTSLVAVAGISAAGFSAVSIAQDSETVTCRAQTQQRSGKCQTVAVETRAQPATPQRGQCGEKPARRQRKAAQVAKGQGCCASKAKAGCGNGQGAAKGKRAQQASFGACAQTDQGGKGKGQCKGKGQGNGQGKGKGKGKGDGQGKGKGKGKGQGKGQGAQLNNAVAVTATVTAPAAYMRRLQSALEDELFAHDVYTSADGAHNARRYQNLARAEQRHANAIAAAIRSLGGEPVLEHKQTVDAATTMVAADKTCEEIELHVIKIYAGLIEDCPDPALLPMLENIQAANRRHLNAVSR